MYVVTSGAVRDAIESDSRTFRAKMDFLNAAGEVRRTLSGQDLGKIVIEHAQTETDTIQIGGVLSRKADITICSGYLPKRGEDFRLYLYLLDRDGTSAEPATHRQIGQWTHRELSMLTHRQIAYLPPTKDIDGIALDGYFIPFGELVVRRAVVKGSTIEVTAFDRLGSSDDLYVPEITFPASSVDVTEDVLRQLGIRERVPVVSGNLLDADRETVLGSDTEEILVSAEYSFTIQREDIEGMTCREVLGGIAAMSGGNGILDRNGAYTVEFLSEVYGYLDNDRLDTPEIGDEDKRITGLVCTVSDQVTLTVGSDDSTATQFSCPWMTQSRLQEIWRTLSTVSWRPISINERLGDPRRDLGDKVGYFLPATAGREAINCQFLTTELRYNFDGGLSVELTSCGSMEEA